MRPLWVYAAPVEGEALSDAVADVATLRCVGVGKAAAACRLTRALLEIQPPWVLGFGLCGAYPVDRPMGRSPALGDLCVVQRETLADDGAVDETGFRDLDAMGLGDVGPFDADPRLVDWAVDALSDAVVVRGATVSTCSGVDALSEALMRRTAADVETMEGAAIALACQELDIPWVQLRCVSNRTGDRHRSGWDLKESIARLHAAMRRLAATQRSNPWTPAP